MRLLVDDKRNISADVICRTSDAAKMVLEDLPISVLILDYDMGKDQKSGNLILRWAIEHDCCPKVVEIVTDNPPGRKSIEATLVDGGYTRTKFQTVWEKVDVPPSSNG